MILELTDGLIHKGPTPRGQLFFTTIWRYASTRHSAFTMHHARVLTCMTGMKQAVSTRHAIGHTGSMYLRAP